VRPCWLWILAHGVSGFDATDNFAPNGYGDHSPGGYSWCAVGQRAQVGSSRRECRPDDISVTDVPLRLLRARRHEQYLLKNPFGYRRHSATGIKVPS
jgi:hypothetical protein